MPARGDLIRAGALGEGEAEAKGVSRKKNLQTAEPKASALSQIALTAEAEEFFSAENDTVIN